MKTNILTISIVVVIAGIVALRSGPAFQARADESSSALAASYAALKQSLALVAYEQGKDLYTGSSFCISSSGGWSYFLTNAHVVGTRDTVAMFLNASPGKVYSGTVIRLNSDLDASVIAVHTPNVPPVTLGSDALPEGQNIAIAGYPSAHITFALLGLGLTPSVHEGIITSYPGDGAFLEFDAQVEHGNSGGPVFDPDTGLVYGLVTLKIGSDQTNLAINISQLRTFIQNANVSVNQSNRQTMLASGSPRAVAAVEETPAPTPKLEKNIFETYIPLRNQDQNYNCGSGIGMVMMLRAYDLEGNFKVTESFTGLAKPIPPSSSLQAHDQYDNILLVGYFGPDGTLTRLAAPQIAIPIRPYLNFQTEIASENGLSTPRVWVGSLVLNLDTGNYPTELYADRLQGGSTFVAGYSDHVGLVAALLFDKGNKLLIGCSLQSITPVRTGANSFVKPHTATN